MVTRGLRLGSNQMTLYNPVDGKELTDRLLAAGFDAPHIEGYHDHVGGAAVELSLHGVRVTICKHQSGGKHAVKVTGIRRPLSRLNMSIEQFAAYLISEAERNRETEVMRRHAVAHILEVFRASGTNIEALTEDLPSRIAARFMLGQDVGCYISYAMGKLQLRGLFKFVAPDMFQQDMVDEEEDEGDNGPSNSFYFSTVSQLLKGLCEMFDQPPVPRKYEQNEKEISTLEKPGVFLDFAFKYGLMCVSEKEVDTFRTAKCPTTAKLLDGDTHTVQLYTLGFKTAPAKL